MADGNGDDKDIPIGQVLFTNLTKALLDCTNAQIAAAQVQRELIGEIKLLREDLEGVGGIAGELCTHLATYLRVLDHVSMESVDRPPRWKDVQDVLREIKDEIQQEEDAQEAEAEEEERDPTVRPPHPPTEIFPRKKTS